VTRAVVFDLYETLVDYDPVEAREFQDRVAGRLGRDPDEFAALWREGRPKRDGGSLRDYLLEIGAANGVVDELMELRRESTRAMLTPRAGAVETLSELRQFSSVPVIMLTVKADDSDVVKGLERGADDYVAKPFSQQVLLSRIKAVLRRAEGGAPAASREVVVDDNLRIDFDRHEVFVRGQQVQLRPTEFRLLYHLATNPGVVLSHETLLSRVWGPEYRDASHYVRLYINYLRQKLEEDPSNPRYVLTERGVGYKFVDYRRNGP